MYIIILLLIIVGLVFLEQFMNNNKANDIPKENMDFVKSFYKKESLLTKNELVFYSQLKQITDKLELTVFCQVAMYEIVNCKNFKDFNRIKSKSIDFVITDKNCKIKFCIELDDYSHNRENRKQRDKIVEAIFEHTNIKLVRIKSQNNYNIENLNEIVKNNI